MHKMGIWIVMGSCLLAMVGCKAGARGAAKDEPTAIADERALEHVVSSPGARGARKEEPAVHADERALGYIVSQQDSETGLVRSYPLENNSYVYDDALALIAFRVGGKSAEADVLAKALMQVQNRDGSFFDSYDVSMAEPLRQARYAGANAWVALALADYAEATKNEAARAAARKCGKWLTGLQDTHGGLFGGCNADGDRLPWKSCEHALDAWFAFTRIGGLEEEAEKVKQWLLQEAWNQQEQRFNRGENDPVIATDCQSWGAIWLVFQGDQAKARQSLAFAEAHLATQDTFNGHLMHGFPAQSSAPQVIWAEGTAQMVVAYAYVGMATLRDYLEELTSIQNADGSWNHSSQNLSQPEVWHSTMESVAGTCWTYFAICAKNEGLYVPFGEPVKQ